MTRAAGIAVIVLGTMAYFASWDTVPGGYSVDAPSNVLNALCIRHTGGDEYGRTLPTSIRAFDDYRPPLLIYVLALSSYLHPLTVKSARFLSMGLGWAALGAFLLLRSHFPLPQIRWALFYPLLFTFLLCSPWILVPHRMPVEFVTTLPVVLFLLLTSWKWIQRPGSHRAAALAALATGLMLYAYYGTKPLAFTHLPLLGAIQFFQQRRFPRSMLTFAAVWGLVAAPTLWDMLGEWHSLARFEAVGTIDPLHWLGALLQHVGPDFLFFTGDHNLRHHTGYGGMLNIVFLPLLLAGSVCLLRKLFCQRDTFWIFLALFGITCLVPVSLTQENLPHALRSLPVFLPLTMVIILGYGDLESRLKERGRTVMVALTASLLLLGGWSSYQSVVHLHRTATEADRSIWSYYPDEYALPDTYVSPANHLTISINERYERVALQGDQLYCFGEAAEQALMETIAATDATERHTPGSLAHRHRKFYAVTLARTGRYDEALERFREFYDGETAVEPDANDIAVHWEWQSITRAFGEQADARGDSVDARGLYKESLIALERLSTWVRSPRLNRRLSLVLTRLGAHRRALAYHVRSFGPGEDPVVGMAEVGARYVREGKPHLGVLAYQTALSNIADMTAEQYTTIGIGLYHAGNLSESSEAYRMAVTVDSTFTDAHAYLGWNLMLGEKTDEAIRHLERARSQRPSPAALFNLGFSYLRAGQVDVARSVYREGVELFGAQSGEEAQAPENLRWLIRRDLHADVAREILLLYWE